MFIFDYNFIYDYNFLFRVQLFRGNHLYFYIHKLHSLTIPL